MGTSASDNIPGARDSAVRWTDSSGNLWLFGGNGFDANGEWGYLNDLWEFNPSTNLWAWMGGSSMVPTVPSGAYWGQSGVYGTLGTPAAGNIPGGRYGAVSWTDSGDQLWLFGGWGFDANSNGGWLNDLWEFNPSTNECVWMGGSSTLDSNYGQPGVYGTLGTFAAGNIPGGRFGAVSWTDSSGHLWLFGGDLYDAIGNQDYLNDLWELNPSTNLWAWMGGSSTVPCTTGSCGQPGVYGTLGTPAVGNIPGSRLGAVSWIDSGGHLWLFGGDVVFGNDGNLNDLNDLWEFNPSTNEWTWMGGSNGTTGGFDGVYGTLATPAFGNIPGVRRYASSWTDSSGHPWLFGGYGFGSSYNPGELNDLWEFNPSTNEWDWMSGSNTVNQTGVFGTLGTPAAGNIPGSLQNAVNWIDSNGNLWLFGGQGYDSVGTYGELNDLWEYQPPVATNLVATTTTLSPAPTPNPSVYGESVTLTSTVSSATGAPPNEENVSFLSGTTSLGTAQLSSGVASLVTTTLPVGTDSITAVYGGDSNFAGSISTAVSQVVNKATPTITWTTPAAVTVGTALSSTQLNPTASVTGNFSYNPTSGTVMSATGNYTLTAIFSPNDTTDYNNNFAQVVLVVNPVSKTTPTVTVTPSSSSILTTQVLSVTVAVSGTPTPTGSVTLSGGGYTSAAATLSGGSATINIPAGSLAVGNDTLTASYTPDANSSTTYNSATGVSSAVTVAVPNPAPAISSLSPAFVSASSAAFTLSVNGTGFTANSTVNWGATALTTTYVSAIKLTAAVTAAEIASAGTSPVTVVTPAPGGGTSNTLTFEIDSSDSGGTPPSFSVATVAVAAGSPASYTVTLPSSVTAATVSCLNLPSGASCSYSAGTVTITTSASTPKGTYQIIVVFTETVTESSNAWILLPILLLPLYFARKKLTRRGAWLSVCVVLVLLTASATIAGCGGGGSSANNQQPPPPQTYQVVSSGTVTLTVQ